MKILFIIPGSGDSFYCGNCFRDNLMATSLRKAGQEAIIMPLYLPLKHPSFQADTPLFFPATTYYAAQKFFGSRRVPRWVERITGSNALLDMAASLSGTTTAEGTEQMTLSMITGDDPAFKEQVERLINWIKDVEHPDIIHLSSTLLLGVAKYIRRSMDIPIVCSVQDEEVWIDSLHKKYVDIAWQGIADNIRYIDRFITTSAFYRDVLARRVPQIKEVEVVYPAVNREAYSSTDYPADPVIGFFYRMNSANGLDILADAFVKLKEKGSIPNLKLKIGGGYTGKDKRFLKKINKTLRPYKQDVEINESYDLAHHEAFYKSISVLSVPLTFDEGVGLYLCEAFAAGRPAIEPATGSFPEIVGNAGLLYYPNDSDRLAEALEMLLTDKDLYNHSVKEALTLSEERYNEQTLADKLLNIYHQLINK